MAWHGGRALKFIERAVPGSNPILVIATCTDFDVLAFFLACTSSLAGTLVIFLEVHGSMSAASCLRVLIILGPTTSPPLQDQLMSTDTSS